MKLFYSPGACSLSVRIIIHEMGIDCEYEAVNLKTKKTATDKDYFTINPKGAVPALLLDNNEVLTENVAIHQYLADTYQATQLLPAIDELARYRVIEWLSYICSDLHKSCGPLFNSQIPKEVNETIFKPSLKSKLKFIDQQLIKHTYLTGEDFTLPDAYLFVILRWLRHFDIKIAEWPKLAHYFDELKKRKSIKQALREENLEA